MNTLIQFSYLGLNKNVSALNHGTEQLLGLKMALS